MKKTTSFLLVVILIIIALYSCDEKQNILSEKEKQDGWQLLFDGKTLNGWKNYNASGIAGWAAEDECLSSNGSGDDLHGYIITEKMYDNFELVFDWKISVEGNSGVLYHVIESNKFETPYLTGPEYQLLDDVGLAQKVENWQKTGADYAMHVPYSVVKQLSPVGYWNTSCIIFDNGHVEYWLNGARLVDFEAWTAEWFNLKNSGKWNMASEYGLSETGYISLQDHGSKVWFRNIKIKKLPKKEKPIAKLFNGVDLSNWISYGMEKWYVQDSLMVCEFGSGNNKYLATKLYYKDFDLIIDFKQISNNNSGIYFHSTFDGTKVFGWQIEIASKGTESGGIYESYGRGWLSRIADKKENILKPDEWNTLRVKVIGPEVLVWLNGQEMIRLNDSLIGNMNGRIAFPIHDDGIKVQWKNLLIKRL